MSTPLLSKGNAGSTFNFTGGTLHADRVAFSLTNNGGVIAPGRLADIVIWNSAPLSSYALADKVLIDGEVYFDRSLPGFGLTHYKMGTNPGAVSGFEAEVER